MIAAPRLRGIRRGVIGAFILTLVISAIVIDDLTVQCQYF